MKLPKRLDRLLHGICNWAHRWERKEQFWQTAKYNRYNSRQTFPPQRVESYFKQFFQMQTHNTTKGDSYNLKNYAIVGCNLIYKWSCGIILLVRGRGPSRFAGDRRNQKVLGIGGVGPERTCLPAAAHLRSKIRLQWPTSATALPKRLISKFPMKSLPTPDPGSHGTNSTSTLAKGLKHCKFYSKGPLTFRNRRNC